MESNAGEEDVKEESSGKKEDEGEGEEEGEDEDEEEETALRAEREEWRREISGFDRDLEAVELMVSTKLEEIERDLGSSGSEMPQSEVSQEMESLLRLSDMLRSKAEGLLAQMINLSGQEAEDTRQLARLTSQQLQQVLSTMRSTDVAMKSSSGDKDDSGEKEDDSSDASE